MTDIKTIEGTFTSGKGNYSIVVGRWNSFVVEPLLKGALDTLRRHGVSDKQITIVKYLWCAKKLLPTVTSMPLLLSAR